MTRLLLYSALLLLTFIPQHLLAQQSKVIELKITGEATEFDKDQQMRLIRVSDGVVIDSVPLKARRFEKVLHLPTSEPYYELCTDAGSRVYLFPESGAVKISFEREVALGTPLNDKFAQLMDKKNELLKRREEKERTLSRDKSISQLEFAMLADSLLSDYDASLAAVYASQLKEHPDDAVGLFCLRAVLRTIDDDTQATKNLVSQVSKRLTQDEEVKEHLQRIQKNATPPGSDLDPAIYMLRGTDMKGQPAALRDYLGKGHYTLVHFWASWCPPCREEMAELRAYYITYGRQGLQIVGVGMNDDYTALCNEAERQAILWPQVFLDKYQRVDGVKYIPRLILFDPKGNCINTNVPREDAEDTLEKLARSMGGKL